MPSHDLIANIRIDTSGFQRSLWDVTSAFRNVPLAMAGRPRMPRRPYPRHLSRMTARQYRAERRRYGRELRAWRKADRAAVRAGARPNIGLFVELNRALTVTED